MQDQVDTDDIIYQKGKCTVRVANEDHIEAIYPFMRQVDKDECSCMGFKPKEALDTALNTDDVTYTAFDAYGVPFCMFGAGPLNLEGDGYIWMLGTDDIANNKYDFIRASRFVVNTLALPYKSVRNFVLESNKTTINWLKYCGAEFGRKVEFSDHPFYEFTITHKENI